MVRRMASGTPDPLQTGGRLVVRTWPSRPAPAVVHLTRRGSRARLVGHLVVAVRLAVGAVVGGHQGSGEVGSRGAWRRGGGGGAHAGRRLVV